MKRLMLLPLLTLFLVSALHAQPTAIRAGRLVDVERGVSLPNQIILIEDGEITALGDDVDIPDDARVIDLSASVVLPGLFDAHTHMAMTTVPARDFGRYYFTTLLEPTPYRAIQGVTNARSMLESGFTTIRDVGNAGNYADTDLRRAIEEGWIPGPTILNSGRIIAPYGGQFRLQPEKKDLAEPEYFFADTIDEIRKAVRENIHFGATVIKLVVDNQPYIYSEEDIRAAVDEAGRVGLKVAAHAYTDESVTNAVRAGVASIEHGTFLSNETLALMKERGVYLVGTDFPESYSPGRYAERIDRLRRAYEVGAPIAFGTDVTYYREGWTRGSLTLEFLDSFIEAGIPPVDILRMMTINAARLLGVEQDRGSLAVGKAADLIAVDGDPLTDSGALRNVHFVMKAGSVYKEANRFVWETPVKIGQ